MNLPGKLAPYSKFITAILGIALTIVTQRYSGASWLPYVVGAGAALGVFGVPNASNSQSQAPAPRQGQASTHPSGNVTVIPASQPHTAPPPTSGDAGGKGAGGSTA